MLLAGKTWHNVVTYSGAAALAVLTYAAGLTGGMLHVVIGGIIAIAGYFLQDAPSPTTTSAKAAAPQVPAATH